MADPKSTAHLHEIDDRTARTRLGHNQFAKLGLTVVPFDEEQAYKAGLLRQTTRSQGLSLGDRACLALAHSLGLPAITADRAWSNLNVGVEVILVR